MYKRIEAPVMMVVFGASGDLTKRKLLPALYNLYQQGFLGEQFCFLGYARTENNDADFRQQAQESVKEFAGKDFNEKVWKKFVTKLHYLSGSYDNIEHYRVLAKRVAELQEGDSEAGNTLFYLSTPPNVFKSITSLLCEVGLTRSGNDAWRRLIIE